MYSFSLWLRLCSVEHFDSPKLQTSNIVEEESSGDESDQPYYMVLGNDSLEVNSDTHLDDCASSSCSDDYVDADALNEELSLFCENLLEKYQILKKKSLKLNKENKNLFSKLNMLCKRGMRFLIKGTNWNPNSTLF